MKKERAMSDREERAEEIEMALRDAVDRHCRQAKEGGALRSSQVGGALKVLSGSLAEIFDRLDRLEAIAGRPKGAAKP